LEGILVNAILKLAILTSAVVFTFGLAVADDQDRTQQQDKLQTQTKTQERIYGSQLMTQQERDEFRSKLRAAKSIEERDQIRKEHHERMKERAKERGINLPDEIPFKGGGMMGPGPGGGMGPGSGYGGGMGSGGGMMGPGGGRNR
jgi:hypothetical protein